MTKKPIEDKDFGYDAVDGKYLESTSSTINYHNWILDSLNKHISKNILEVGSGVGLITEKLSQRYGRRKIYCLEPSQVMFPILKKKIKNEKLKITKVFTETIGDNKNKLKKLKLDTLIYINVLEHIKDDVDEMKQAYDLLEKGGKIVTFSPAGMWLYSPRDKRTGHYRRYSLQEKVDKMKQAGFEIVEYRYFDIVGSFLWWGKFRLLKSDKISGGQTGFYDKKIVPVLSKIEPKWLPFGKNIIVVGRKK